MRTLIAAALALGLATAASAQQSVDGGRCAVDAPVPARAVFCFELVPTPAFLQLRGRAALEPAATPFGAAVTAEGTAVHRLALTLDGLPEPGTLGPYTTYVAWAAPPALAPMLRLGAVGNGTTRLGDVAMNKFIVFVTAERSADVAERGGPLVLRGTSPSMRMNDTHFLGVGSTTAEDEHAHHTHAADGAPVWTMPPMDPRVAPMPMPGLETAVPAATPWLPGHGVDPASLPEALPREVLDLADGDTVRLVAGLVRRKLKGQTLVLYAYNGQHPGPLLRVRQGATVHVEFTNGTEWPTAVHWHGVRLDNAFDGVPHVTQEPVAPEGGRFMYRVRFPDAGIYWYHPHHREDAQQDLGLYGNIQVNSSDPAYYGPAHREEVLVLDDLLLGDAGLVPYGAERATHAIMGRFGNVLLVDGEPAPGYRLRVRRGEVVRFHLTNASNVRPFNVSFPGARMKVVASDVSRFEREAWVESVAMAPAERYIVDVRFDSAGTHLFANRVQALDHGAQRYFAVTDTLGFVEVAPEPAEPELGAAFERLRESVDVAAEIERLGPLLGGAPELELVLRLEDTGLPFALEQLLWLDSRYFQPVEWVGTMAMMDWLPTTEQVRWVLREPATGRENGEIDWRFRLGDVVRIRLRNDADAIHAMQHPIHIHGQRFLVTAVNGVPTTNRAWKDTVLVPVGATVDILLELSNPGRWMLHCHVAEHLEAGMSFVFEVEG